MDPQQDWTDRLVAEAEELRGAVTALQLLQAELSEAGPLKNTPEGRALSYLCAQLGGHCLEVRRALNGLEAARAATTPAGQG